MQTRPAAPPFLRWAGSKRQHSSLLASFWRPSYRRYVEPFLGSGVVFFHVNPPRALLGDINADLIATFRQVKKDPEAVSRRLSRLEKGPDSYYRLRALDTSRLKPPQRAARFIFLNRFCFNGIYRTNSAGLFNVPYGGDKSGPLPQPRLLRACSSALAHATLMAADFETLLERVTPGDFVYLDPPYSILARRTFAQYHPTGFGPRDVTRLRALITRLDRQGIPFLLSYAESDEAAQLSRGFATFTVTARRNVAGFAQDRRQSTELLIYNSPPDE